MGKPNVIGYASKTLPNAYLNYRFTELEMTGLVVNMHLWLHLLNNNDFNACVDYISVTNIVKAKTLLTSQRIIRLLDLLSKFKFSLYYVKGKDVILADFLSRIAIDDGDPSEVILISFDCLAVLKDNFNHFLNKFLIATRETTKESGIKPPEFYGTSKILNTIKKPEHQNQSLSFLKNHILTS